MPAPTSVGQPSRELIVVNGPVASGKSTVALALAAVCEGAGYRTAVVDLDEIWHMVEHQTSRSGGLRPWLIARHAAAAITDTFFAEGIGVVIVEGPFFTPEERSAYTRWLKGAVTPVFVTLDVSFEESYRRVQADPHPDRVVSRDRGWLQDRHAETRPLVALLPPSEPIFQTDGRDPEELAREIATTLKITNSRNAPAQRT